MTCMTQRSVFRLFFVAFPTMSYDAVLQCLLLLFQMTSDVDARPVTPPDAGTVMIELMRAALETEKAVKTLNEILAQVEDALRNRTAQDGALLVAEEELWAKSFTPFFVLLSLALYSFGGVLTSLSRMQDLRHVEYNLRLIHTLAIFFTWPVFVFVAMGGVMCRGSIFDAPAAFWNRVRNGFAPGGGNGGDPPAHLGRTNGRQSHGSPKKSKARRTKNNHAVRYYFWLLELMLILFFVVTDWRWPCRSSVWRPSSPRCPSRGHQF